MTPMIRLCMRRLNRASPPKVAAAENAQARFFFASTKLFGRRKIVKMFSRGIPSVDLRFEPGRDEPAVLNFEVAANMVRLSPQPEQNRVLLTVSSPQCGQYTMSPLPPIEYRAR